MFYNFLNERVKARLDCEIGCYILSELYGENEYDILDAYSVIAQFTPAGYIPCRENYFYRCF